MNMKRPDSVSACALALILAACATDTPGEGSRSLEAVRDTIGDTVVVRTLSGSAWGSDAHLVPETSFGELEGDLEYLLGDVVSIGVGAEGTIYIVDGQVPELRAYDANGTYLRTMAGPGEGPGELNSPDGGLAILSDERVVVRDPGNTRLQVFSADGSESEAWPVVRGGFITSSPLWWDRDDNVYVFVITNMDADLDDWEVGLARIHPDGTAADTLTPPTTGFKSPTVEARNESSLITNLVPFSAAEESAFHPGGYYVHGISTSYAVTLMKDDGPVRIVRDYEPVPVQADERSARQGRIERNMRRVEPGWSWNGPRIPDTKPPFTDLFVARDGRIWVQVSQRGIEEENPDYDPREEDSEATRWRDPVAFDVFGEDGTFYGRVRAPDGFSTRPTPFIDGDNVWAVTRDGLGVQRVVRFRVELDQTARDD
jgi:hypothetical protein